MYFLLTHHWATPEDRFDLIQLSLDVGSVQMQVQQFLSKNAFCSIWQFSTREIQALKMGDLKKKLWTINSQAIRTSSTCSYWNGLVCLGMPFTSLTPTLAFIFQVVSPKLSPTRLRKRPSHQILTCGQLPPGLAPMMGLGNPNLYQVHLSFCTFH